MLNGRRAIMKGKIRESVYVSESCFPSEPLRTSWVRTLVRGQSLWHFILSEERAS